MPSAVSLVSILVTDGEQRAALALTRSLGAAGYQVFVCSQSGKSLAGASRWCRAEFLVPDPLAQPGDFATEVSALSERLNVHLVVPVSEGSLLAVLASPPATRRLVPFPDLGQVKLICDKARVLAVAPEVGIAIPRQVTIAHQADGRTLDTEGLVFPLVIKPSRSVSDDGGRRIKLGVMHAASVRELRQAIEAIPAAGYPLMLQQRIVGPGVGVFLLLWRGKILAQFSHRRLREKPPSGGVSVYRESIPADPLLVARSHALLERFGWEGVAMIEYKVEAATGTPYLMEINGRFWGSLQLAIDSGVDFPRLLVEAALGTPAKPVLRYRTGVRSRWWWGDFDHLLARIRRNPDALGLPPGAPGRLRAVLDFLTLWRPGDRSEICRWTDPAPFLRETSLWLRRQ